ncbi:MAG: hypothetical protein ABIM64_04085 [candidate division WOR-3 bacterium]
MDKKKLNFQAEILENEKILLTCIETKDSHLAEGAQPIGRFIRKQFGLKNPYA